MYIGFGLRLNQRGLFGGGAAPSNNFLLLETGDFLLLETGDKIII